MKAYQNLYVCLVHEAPDCVRDLVQNLRYNDRASGVLLYNGSSDPNLLEPIIGEFDANVFIHPQPQVQRWGYLHHFALDCMEFATASFDIEFLTFIDSDQLSVRHNYSRFILKTCDEERAGVLGTAAHPQPRNTSAGPAKAAWDELDLWLPYLRRFEDGVLKFPHWTFWPGTVFRTDVAEALARHFKHDAELKAILLRSKIWATEEVILPTVASLLGYKIAKNPSCNRFVAFRTPWSLSHLEEALCQDNVYWIHPVRRHYTNPLRQAIRDRFCSYENFGH